MEDGSKYTEDKRKSVENMNITVVDSVKGGCGKTSISFKRAIELADENEQSGKVCYLDLDLLGSSIETFLVGKKFVGEKFSGANDEKNDAPIKLDLKKAAKYYLNAIFDGEQFSPKFLNEIDILSSEGDCKGSFCLIACDPEQDKKERFKPSRQINYAGQIDYEYFAAVIEKILDQLCDMGFTHVIIDMPPNSDAYTDSLFNILLRKASAPGEKDIKTKYNVEIYVVNSFDTSHFIANCEWLKTMSKQADMKWAIETLRPFKMVFNDNINYSQLCKDKGNNDEDGIKLSKRRMNKMVENYKNAIDISETYLYNYDKSNVYSSAEDSGIGFDSVKKTLVESEVH